MCKNSITVTPTPARHGERGAALITALLLAMLLLSAGGAVIVASSLANTTAIDSTAEMQAYYAAEAGLQSGLNVLRGNTAPLAGTTTATFRNALTSSNLNLWLTYGANSRVTLTANTSYDLTVTDPDNTPVGQEPSRLIVRATGYGPKGSIKRLELMISGQAFSFTPVSTVTLRGSDTSTEAMPDFSVGSSAPHSYSGTDRAGGTALPAFGVTNNADYGNGTTTGVATLAINGDASNITGASQLTKLDMASLNVFLQTAGGARTALTLLEGMARKNNRYFSGDTGDIGSAADPKFTFVDGDLSLSGNPGRGGGLLVVTGTLTMSGSSSWDGLILVLGEGNVQRNGTPDIFGSVVVAKFDRYGTGGFEAPSFHSNGGGNSKVQYDSDAVNKALNLLGSRVIGVREY